MAMSLIFTTALRFIQQPRLDIIGVKGDAIIMIDRFLHWLRRPSTILSLIVAAMHHGCGPLFMC